MVLYFYFNVFTYRLTCRRYIWLWFTAFGQRALFFAFMVSENNMAGVWSFKLNLTCFEFILVSILIAASIVFYIVSTQTTKPVALIRENVFIFWMHKVTMGLIIAPCSHTVFLCIVLAWDHIICLSSQKLHHKSVCMQTNDEHYKELHCESEPNPIRYCHIYL